jgi:hypothetical protein
MNKLTALRTALLDALGAITQAEGFRTNAGHNVKSGWFEDIIQTRKESSPVIVVQRGKNAPPTIEAGELVLRPGYIIVGAVDAGLHNYDAELDNLEADIYSALIGRCTRVTPWAPYGTYKITFGEPLAAPPGGGHNWASLAIPVNFNVILPLKED